MNRLALISLLFAAAVALTAPPAALAQRTDALPRQLEGVGIEEHLDQAIPLSLPFTDETGRAVTLGEFFHPGRPVILTLVYYDCPMLCTLVLNGLTDAMQEIPWTPGREFEIVTVSFNPSETPTLAKLKKQNYLVQYGRPGAGPGWHFLTGTQESIAALTQAVGFHYRWDDEQKQYVHAAAIYVLTPDGRLSRYLYGVQFEPKTLRLSLIEASKGRIGSPLDQIVLYCFHYDASSGRYSLAAMRVMRAGGVLTVLILGAWLSALWMRGRRRGDAAPPEARSQEGHERRA